MKKLLVLASLAFMACEKDDNTSTQPGYYGKWYILQTVNKQYTIENGDTAYTRYDITDHSGSDYIDFQTNSGSALLFMNNVSDSMSYESVTHSYFKLDSTLCEINYLTDSTFGFNTLSFDPNVIPDRIQVTQNFFILHK